MRSLVNILASTVLSLLGAFLGVVFLIPAILIALAFVVGCRFSGKLDQKRVVILFTVIVITWIIALMFIPVIGERIDHGVPWYYHHLKHIEADAAAIAVGLILIMIWPPNKWANNVVQETSAEGAPGAPGA